MKDFIINKKDLYVDFDKFNSGESNILLITGLSGSGKSTLANNLAERYKCKNFELDYLDFYLDKDFNKEDIKETEPALYDFIEQKHIKPLFMNAVAGYGLYKEYIKFVISWCKHHKNERFIINGFQIYKICRNNDTFITNNPIIIKGTSGLISAIRGIKRSSEPFLKEFKEYMRYITQDYKKINTFKNLL